MIKIQWIYILKISNKSDQSLYLLNTYINHIHDNHTQQGPFDLILEKPLAVINIRCICQCRIKACQCCHCGIWIVVYIHIFDIVCWGSNTPVVEWFLVNNEQDEGDQSDNQHTKCVCCDGEHCSFWLVYHTKYAYTLHSLDIDVNGCTMCN